MENGKNFPPDTIPRAYEEKRETGPPPEAPVPTPLTEPQRRFAAQYHALIYGFLLEKKLEIREYYDIAAIGYLHAVQRYFTEKSLHRYRFSTIAWRSMNSSLHTFRRQEQRRQSHEVSYQAAHPPPDDAFDTLRARLSARKRSLRWSIKGGFAQEMETVTLRERSPLFRFLSLNGEKRSAALKSCQI